MRYLILMTIVCFAISCRGQENSPKDLCKKLVKMYEQDQLHRGNDEIEDPFFSVFDSVRNNEGISKKMYMAYTKEQQLEYGKKIRAIVDRMNLVNQKVVDSLMFLQKEIDIQNTKDLLDIVLKNGFPSMEKLNCEGYSAPFLIFLHSPEEYWDKIRDVINIELKDDRMTKGDYDYILWHVNGRKGSPF